MREDSNIIRLRLSWILKVLGRAGGHLGQLVGCLGKLVGRWIIKGLIQVRESKRIQVRRLLVLLIYHTLITVAN